MLIKDSNCKPPIWNFVYPELDLENSFSAKLARFMANLKFSTIFQIWKNVWKFEKYAIGNDISPDTELIIASVSILWLSLLESSLTGAKLQVQRTSFTDCPILSPITATSAEAMIAR